MATITVDQALIDAWNELQAVPSYVEQQARAFASEPMSVAEMGRRWDGEKWVECPVEDQDPRY